MKYDNYKNLIQNSFNETILNRFTNLLTNIYGDFKFFYGKNIVNEEKDELYFFYKTKIVKVTFNEIYSSFELTEFKIDFKSIQLKLSEEYGDYTKLIINLESGEEIIFDSLKDSNKSWENKYEKKLIELLEYLNGKSGN